MNMTEKNGQPSMEEILASIRRIIAEEPGQHHNGELGGTPILLKGDGVLDDAGDFDLPAIFRASPPQTDRATPLLGRLTDAIRSATAAQPEDTRPVELETVADTHSNGAHAGLSALTLRSADASHAEPAHLNGSHYHSTSEAPAADAAPAPFTAPVVHASSTGEPKRVMASFKDTHFSRLSSAPAEALPEPEPVVVAPYVAPAPVEAEVVVPFSPPPVEFTPEAVAPVLVAVPPPPLPAAAAAPQAAQSTGEPTGAVEDATADLLRPMLRQWLAENMPRMVEKALHIEIAESVKAPPKKL